MSLELKFCLKPETRKSIQKKGVISGIAYVYTRVGTLIVATLL
jgi:hypothetical protein